MSDIRQDALLQLKEEIVKIIREDFDPTPPNWDGEWYDNAEDAADKVIVALSRFIRGGRLESVIPLSTEGEHLK